MDTITFLHSGEMGDIIASLGAVKEICDREKKKAVVYLDTTGGLKANDGEINKVMSLQSNGKGLRFNHASYEFLMPLILCQPYVYTVCEYDGSQPLPHIDYNLNAFRKCFVDRDTILKTNQNLLYLHQVALGLDFGYKGPWLFISNDEDDRRYDTILARTSRYQSAHVFYAAYENEFKAAHFIGTDFEYDLFENAFGYRPNRLKVTNAANAAIAIANSKQFVSNGTLFYWIAVGLGHPKIIHEIGVDVPTTYFRDHKPQILYVQGGHHLK